MAAQPHHDADLRMLTSTLRFLRRPFQRVPAIANSRSRRHRTAGAVGIDIGSTAIKLARVVGDAGRWRLAWTLKLPARLDAAAIRKHVLRDRLRGQFAGEMDFVHALAVASMSFVEIRSLSLPDASPNELQGMIAGELEADEPDEPAIFAHWSPSAASGPDGNPNSGLKTVTVASMAGSVTSAIAEDLADAGFCCTVLDALPLALARAVELSSPGKTTAALDLGAANATFVLSRGGEPLFVRKLRGVPVNQLLEAASKQYKLTAEQTGLLLQIAQRGELKPLVNGYAHSVAYELNRTLDFIRHDPTLPSPENVFLFGGGAGLAGLREALQILSPIPLVAWSLDATASASGDDAIYGPAIAMSILGGLLR